MEIINYAEGGLENTGLLEEMTREWEADWEETLVPRLTSIPHPNGRAPSRDRLSRHAGPCLAVTRQLGRHQPQGHTVN